MQVHSAPLSPVCQLWQWRGLHILPRLQQFWNFFACAAVWLTSAIFICSIQIMHTVNVRGVSVLHEHVRICACVFAILVLQQYQMICNVTINWPQHRRHKCCTELYVNLACCTVLLSVYRFTFLDHCLRSFADCLADYNNNNVFHCLRNSKSHITVLCTFLIHVTAVLTHTHTHTQIRQCWIIIEAKVPVWSDSHMRARALLPLERLDFPIFTSLAQAPSLSLSAIRSRWGYATINCLPSKSSMSERKMATQK